MKIIILGIHGMLGSALFNYFSEQKDCQVYGISRDKIFSEKINKNGKIIIEENITDLKKLKEIIEEIKPEIIINSIGVVKQSPQVNNLINLIAINSLFPQYLAKECSIRNIKLFQISTDCVFSGAKGNYAEDDIVDPRDEYGASKYLGEVKDSNCLTIRTSIIGPELKNKNSLYEWFKRQDGVVKGYRESYFSGVTTLELSKIIKKNFIDKNINEGLYHVAGPCINKNELLRKIKKIYKLKIEINNDDEIRINRTLNSNKMKALTGYQNKNWDDMLVEMKIFEEKYYD